MKLREDQNTLASEQLLWLLRGSNLDIEACTLLLGLELRKQRFIPVSAEEEEAILKRLLAIARQGNWMALHELLLILMQRPGFLNHPLTGEATGLLTDCAEREPSSAAGAFLLWSRYFGYFAKAAPEQALAEAQELVNAADSQAASSQKTASPIASSDGLPLLRCLLALHKLMHGSKRQGIQELRRLETTDGDNNATRFLARLPHARSGTGLSPALRDGNFSREADDDASLLEALRHDDRAGSRDSLEEPVSGRLRRLLALSTVFPRLLADYLWQGLVCTKDRVSRESWLVAMTRYMPPIGGQSYYMEAFQLLYGIDGAPKSPLLALKTLSRAAAQHYVPALDLLADITGRGLWGCKPGACEDPDDENWVEQGCRHLAPRALAVFGLLHGHRNLEATLQLPGRLGSFTLRELLEWCGRQDADCLCQACHALFLVEEAMKEERVLKQKSADKQGDSQVREQVERLTGRTWGIGRRLFDALRLAQAMADAGTFLHVARELLRLNEEDRGAPGAADRRMVPYHASFTCMDLLQGAERVGEESNVVMAKTADDCFLLAVFCLKQAELLGEPGAQTILKSLDKKAVTLALQDVRAMKLTVPLKNLVCLTNCVLV